MSEFAMEWKQGPAVMWRMTRRGGETAHAILDPRPSGAAVVWFVNDRPLGFREFTDWTAALRWLEQLQTQNWAAGWRLVAD